MKRIILTLTTILVFSTIIIMAQERQIRVACVGNSITEGAGWDKKTYPAQLAVLLGEKYDVRNFGLGGRTLLMNGDFPYRNEDLFKQAKEFDPQIVIIKLGTNDSKPQNWKYKDEFFNDYVALVQEFRKDGKNPQIFVCFPPPVFKDGFGITNSIIHDEIIPLIDSVRKTCNTLLIDFNSPMVKDSALFPDGIHPNGDGYAVMAKIAYNTITANPLGMLMNGNLSSPTNNHESIVYKSPVMVEKKNAEDRNIGSH